MGIKVTHGHHEYGKGVVDNSNNDKDSKHVHGNKKADELAEERELEKEKKEKEEALHKKIQYQSPKDIWFTADLIKDYRIDEAITQHPLAKQHISMRSKLAYKDLLTTLSPTKKYLLPGQIVVFEYLEPKFKDELEYYDRTPCTLFCGITRTKDGNIREIGLNLHYFPPYSRAKILNTTYEVFKDYYKKYFNNPPNKPNMFISWKALKALLNKHQKIAFGIKMYIPTLRSRSYVIPTKMISTAAYTEGNFSKATRALIMQYWRHFKT